MDTAVLLATAEHSPAYTLGYFIGSAIIPVGIIALIVYLVLKRSRPQNRHLPPAPHYWQPPPGGPWQQPPGGSWPPTGGWPPAASQQSGTAWQYPSPPQSAPTAQDTASPVWPSPSQQHHQH